MYTCNEIAQLISDEQKPFIFLDTCSILDIIRAPIQSHVNSTQVEKLEETILNKNFYISISEHSITEWERNHKKTQDEVKRTYKSLALKVNSILEKTNKPNNLREYHPIPLQNQVLDHLFYLAQAVLNQSLVAKTDREHTEKARSRCLENTPPSKQGRNNIIDCEIFETFLSIKSKNIKNKSAFSSSNTKDFKNKAVLDEITKANSKYFSCVFSAFFNLSSNHNNI